MIKVGLTGGIGSGKSTAARILGISGIPVYDSDARAKRLMNTDQRLREQVVSLLGCGAYSGDADGGPGSSGNSGSPGGSGGALDRAYVAGLVFSDPPLLERLNSFVHPAVRNDFIVWAEAQCAPYVVMESAILFECGMDRDMDFIISVTAPMELRLERAGRRDDLQREVVAQRASNQISDQERNLKSDFVLINDEKHLIIPQIIEIHKKLLLL